MFELDNIALDNNSVAFLDVSKFCFEELTGSLIPRPANLVGFSMILNSISLIGFPTSDGIKSSIKVLRRGENNS